jgi:hypothetical protein
LKGATPQTPSLKGIKEATPNGGPVFVIHYHKNKPSSFQSSRIYMKYLIFHVFHHPYKIDANFYNFFLIGRLKMLTLSFILWMIFAANQSGKMLRLQGLLRYDQERLYMSPESMQKLMQKLHRQHAKFTCQEVNDLKLFRLLAFLCGKLFLPKSCHHQIGIPVHVIRSIMTMGIPRKIEIRHIVKPQVSIYQHILELFGRIPRNSVVRDLSGAQYSVGTEYKLSIGILTVKLISRNAVHMTRHPTKNFNAMSCQAGNVWIQNSDDSNGLFHLIYDAKFDQNNRALSCEFHPSTLLIAIGVIGSVYIIEFSHSLDSFELRKKIPFGEKPNFFGSSIENFWVTQIQWHPSETCFTAISHSGSSGLVKSFLLNKESDVIHQANCAYKGRIAPSCLCFSPDGNFAVTGDSNGLLSFWRVINQDNELTFEILKSDCVLAEGCRIKKIQFFPQDSILAIQTSSKKSKDYDDVYIVKISKSFDVEILKTISYLSHFDFYRDFLLIQSRFSIIIYILNSDNLPTKITEFKSQNGPIASCLLTTVNRQVIIFYSYVGDPVLHKAALEFK